MLADLATGGRPPLPLDRFRLDRRGLVEPERSQAPSSSSRPQSPGAARALPGARRSDGHPVIASPAPRRRPRPAGTRRRRPPARREPDHLRPAVLGIRRAPTSPRTSSSSTTTIIACLVTPARRASSVSRVPVRRSTLSTSDAWEARRSGQPRSSSSTTRSAANPRCAASRSRPSCGSVTPPSCPPARRSQRT